MKMKHVPAITLLILAFGAVFLQASLNWPRRLFGAQVDLLPALLTFAALRLGVGSVFTLALLGGLAFDALSLNPLGASPLPLFLAGLALHVRREHILRDQPFAQFVLGLLMSGVVPLVSLGLILSLGQKPLLGWGFVWDWVVMTVGGGIATPLLFLLMDGIEHALTYRPVTQSSFRPDREIRRGRH